MKSTVISLELELEVNYTYVSADPDVGMSDGAEDMTVVAVNGSKDPALIALAQKWLDTCDDIQMQVHGDAREAADYCERD